MFKKGFTVICLFMFAAIMLFSSDMSVDYDASPSSVSFHWAPVAGAMHYDIYKDNEFVARISDGSTSYTVERLYCSTFYSFTFASRDEQGNTLDAAWLDVTTDTWDGLYSWVNKTDKDNKGKLKHLVVRVEMKIDPVYGQYPEIWFQNDDGSENRIFPLFDFDDPDSALWHKFKEDSEAGRAYRENANRFNTTVFNPGKWKLDKVVIDTNETTAYILTSILSFELTTWSKFVFFEGEDGIKRLSLETKGEEAITNSFIFKNPNPDEDSRFILTKVN